MTSHNQHRKQTLHEQYEPEDPIHHAVNITSRALKDRLVTVEHDEYDLWKAHDEEIGVTSEQWWDDPETAIERFAHHLSNRICFVNECMTYLGDSEALYCDECHPDEYIECAHPECDFPTSHVKTEHCSSHTWRHGREAREEYDDE